MRKAFLLLTLWLSLSVCGLAQGSGPITVTDGTHTGRGITTFRFPDGSVTISGKTATVSGGSGIGTVDSVFGRTGAVVAASNDYTWAQINKTTSSIADITTRSASDLSSGTLAAARGGAGTISGILKADGAGLVSGVVIGSNLTFDGTTLNGPSGTGSGTTGFSASTTYDPTSLLNGESETVTVTVTGASVGDLATVSFTVALPAGVWFSTPQITATNTAKVTLVNESGSTQDIASGTLKISTVGTGTGTVSNTGTLTSGKAIIGNGTTDVKASKVTITDPATAATLTIADNKTATFSNSITIAGTDSSTLNVGAGGTLGSAAFTASSAYEVPLTFGNGVARSVNAVSLDLTSANTFTAAQGVNASSAAAFFVGPNGNTNPALRIVSNVSSAATGLSITGNAAAAGVTLTVLSSGTDESLLLVPKGTGQIVGPVGAVGTPAYSFTGGLTTGLYYTTNQINYAIAGTIRGAQTSTGYSTGTNAINFGSAVGSTDVALIRGGAAGVIRLQGSSASAAGNLVIGTSSNSIGTSGVGVLAIGSATAPSSSPADETQLYSADWNGAGTAALHVLNEEGNLYKFGSTFVIPVGFSFAGVAATGTIPRGDGSKFVASAYTMAAPGTSGNVLTSDGTNWLSSAPSGGGGGDWDSITAPNANQSLDMSTFTSTWTANTAITNTANALLTLGHNTSGTPAAGFGTKLLFQGESTTTTDQDMGAFRFAWTDATHASKESVLGISLATGPTFAEPILFESKTSTSITQMRLIAPSGGTQGDFVQIAGGAGTTGIRYSFTGAFKVFEQIGGSTGLLIDSTATRLPRGYVGDTTTNPTGQFDVKSQSASRVAAIFSSAASPSTDIAQFQINGTNAVTITKDGAVQLKSVAFSALPTVANGALIYCSDCTLASPCASGGSGALAKGINSAWVCN